MPFKDGVFDNVVCFNVLEHVYEYPEALAEIRRVLKINGLLHGYVPFLCNIHSDPFDYWRFTRDCLEKALRQSGFACKALHSQGGVFIAGFDLVSFVIRKLRPLYVLFALLALLGDKLLDRIRPSYRARFPLGYFFVGLKSSVDG
jgi:SAM-dependent methyltransferase